MCIDSDSVGEMSWNVLPYITDSLDDWNEYDFEFKKGFVLAIA